MILAPLTLIVTEHGTRIHQRDAETLAEAPAGAPASETLDSVLLIQIEPDAAGLDLAELQIRFHNPTGSPARIREIIDAQDLGTMTSYCVKGTTSGSGSTLGQAAANYINGLPTEDTMIILREYTKYLEDGTILDGFMGGLAAYLTLVVLNENGAFAKHLPLQFGIPGQARQGNLLNKNMFRYLTLPLLALAKTTRGVIRELVTFVQSFINMWDTAFADGPRIDSEVVAVTQLEVITGLSQYTIRTLGDEASQRQALQTFQAEIKAEVHSALRQLRREFQNLLIETRESINELLDSARNQLIESERVSQMEQNLRERKGEGEREVVRIVDSNLLSYESQSSDESSSGFILGEISVDGGSESIGGGGHFDLNHFDGDLHLGSQVIVEGHRSVFELPESSSDPVPTLITTINESKKPRFRPWQQRRTLIVAPDDPV